jgi:hypothetical protein
MQISSGWGIAQNVWYPNVTTSNVDPFFDLPDTVMNFNGACNHIVSHGPLATYYDSRGWSLRLSIRFKPLTSGQLWDTILFIGNPDRDNTRTIWLKRDNSNQLRLEVQATDHLQILGAFPVIINSYHNVTVVWDPTASQMSAWINDTLVQSVIWPERLWDGVAQMLNLGHERSSACLNAEIASFKMYHRVVMMRNVEHEMDLPSNTVAGATPSTYTLHTPESEIFKIPTELNTGSLKSLTPVETTFISTNVDETVTTHVFISADPTETQTADPTDDLKREASATATSSSRVPVLPVTISVNRPILILSIVAATLTAMNGLSCLMYWRYIRSKTVIRPPTAMYQTQMPHDAATNQTSNHNSQTNAQYGIYNFHPSGRY